MKETTGKNQQSKTKRLKAARRPELKDCKTWFDPNPAPA